MIAKGSTTIVNFYVTDTDGIPATGQASNISASISIDGGSAATISATISEKDSTNLPGWYKFEYTFNTAGNAFITFSCSGCIIMPWEEQVVELSASSAPSASDIAYAVWNDKNTYPIFQGEYPKGYYQANPPIVNVWGQQAYPQQTATYGDLLKGTATNVSAVKAKTYNLPISPASSADLAKVLSGLLHWTVSANTLTLYDSSNNSLGTYSLTRDSSGNITGVTPN